MDKRKAKVISNLEISGFNESQFLRLQPLLSINNIPVILDNIPSQEDISQFPEFSKLHIPSVKANVDLLIGNDNRHILQPHEVINSADGHYALRSDIGWVVSCGRKGGNFSGFKSNFFNKTIVESPHPICSLCSKVVDSLQNKNQLSREQGIFMDMVSNSIHHQSNNHYEIPLPLRNVSVQLPNNFSQAVQRANSLQQKFERNADFFNDYKTSMEDMISNGYAEKVDNPDDPVDRTWYIPHHVVYHKTKPSKLRVVFDCSAKFKGISLNDLLLPGPVITNSLIGVLTRFRREPVAIQGDIQAMFHQVQVPSRDRDLLRFLWWEKGNIKESPRIYRMCVYLFGTLSSPSCANFALKQTAKDNENDFSPVTIDTVNHCFYVDDCLTSAPTAEEATNLLKELCELLAKGGFKLTKWTSNSRKVIESVPPCNRSKELMDLDLTSAALPKEHALGLQWNVEQDTLCFKVNVRSKPATRRGILSVVNSVFDPLGYGAPAILPMKVLLQELCKSKLDWDDPIPYDMEIQWKELLQQLPLLNSFSIPRCYKPEKYGSVVSARIHHFSDASEKAYGYVSYLRLVDDRDIVHCSLLIGKTKLAPLKSLTVPRLELCAATIAINLDQTLRQELQLPFELLPSVFWTDSTTVLRYIRNESAVYHTFVANRVQQIRNSSEVLQWRYVPTNQNSADDPSRGMSVPNFLKSNRWILGPEFLWHPESRWPEQPSFFVSDFTDPEIKRQVAVKPLCFAVSHEQHDGNVLDNLILRFSSWHKLLRVTACMLMYKRLFLSCLTRERSKPDTLETSPSKFGTLTTAEISEAEKLLFLRQQQIFYADELKMLTQKRLIKKSSSISKLDPILREDGLIRVGGRLKLALVSDSQKHPVILHPNSPLANLIVMETHCKLGHAGREHVLAELRQKVWLIKGSSTVRKILANCIECRKKFRPALSQKMADLPKERLIPNEPPFTYVGTDCFGHFLTRRGRSEVKWYGVIFTCLTTRAIHLEMIFSMDTSSFIQALRRFVARRGQVKKIVSDNGSNFVGGERELRDAIVCWNNEQIHNFMLQKQIDWSFNPPASSHFGGIYERQIRSVRKHLKAICREQLLTDESLLTLLCEVECIVNNRPLTSVSSDPNDFEPLTPNHLLFLKTDRLLPPGIFYVKDIYSRKQWRQVQYLANIFWRRWQKEYLPLLQQRQKWTHPEHNLSINDVVLVVDNNLPRNVWLMGRVVEVFPDKSGFVRTARVRTKNSIITRPIVKLVLLTREDQQ